MIPKLDEYKKRWQLPSDDVIKPGLQRMLQALQQLGQPQQSLQVIHFAGTNGKGSTLTFVEQMAREHGLTVGKFMSPCIVDVHDQIQMNGQPITQAQMDAGFKQMVTAGLQNLLTDFELLTCAALQHFHNEQVDLVLLEAGMGGREDSTNIVMPIVSVIPSIALEHTNFLGTTLAQIAAHKAGIIKQERPVVIGRLPKEAYEVVKAEAQHQNAPFFALGEAFEIDGTTYHHKARQLEIRNLQRRLLGTHQGENMAVAITSFLEAAATLSIAVDIAAIERAVYAAQVAGRFEQVLPHVYFDGAHNPASIAALVQTIQQQFPNEQVEIVLGMLADKDVAQAIQLLATVASKFIFVDFDNPRAMKATQMLEMQAGTIMTLPQAANYLKHDCKTKIVTGSLYLLSELRAL
ncbi:folylpolyglutamate synthase/dihydrofolate synthase family protein [Lysinibacillus louembei]|uniref:tetrahydrofolate synthase n=1 Tax=Lysinibacillus louembei TaxID=1470088 RepID=A0ABZ0RUB6_9BACI|nr:folylpolyglutamate synthase/dihydrofolate synthase family protein [Lysinibacillus louembei]WPK10796.1 folylpolyglutamate synthase/dihydrofolate synthase family protein [Lysinibacillus louembei]